MFCHTWELIKLFKELGSIFQQLVKEHLLDCIKLFTHRIIYKSSRWAGRQRFLIRQTNTCVLDTNATAFASTDCNFTTLVCGASARSQSTMPLSTTHLG